MEFTDRIQLSAPRKTVDGYLVSDARVARAGIQIYSGREVGKPELATVRVYRPPDEVFNKDSLHGYAHRPVTNNHPKESVTADNWRRYAAGMTGDTVARDGDFVVVPLSLMDAQAIKDYESGKRELSMGYSAELVFDSGITADGQEYDAVQKGLRMNHLALVDRARGGDKLRIGDDDKGKSNMSDTRKVIVDGLQVDTTDQGAQAIEKLIRERNEARDKITTDAAAHADVVKAKDRELATKDTEIQKLKDANTTPAQLDALVAERAALVADAASLAPGLDVKGKSPDEIRTAVVKQRCGDGAVQGKSADYIAARFDSLRDSKPNAADPVHGVIRNGVVRQQDADSIVEKSYSERDKRLNDAWRGTEATANN